MDGFREAGDIQRLILLVTDGEDHDSYPLEAAKAAQEKGVRIVSIGFGDEAGSKIEVTDPRTGARSFVKDRNGNDVVSRLDGETLREIALQTDGAYVPAGTGAMDLESIYRTHIASMLRGSTDAEQQIVRNEAYQWLVLAALVLLFMGLILAAPFNLRTRGCLAGRTALSTATRATACWLGLSLATSLPCSMPNRHPPRPRKPRRRRRLRRKSRRRNDRPHPIRPAPLSPRGPRGSIRSRGKGLAPRGLQSRCGLRADGSRPAERYLNLAPRRRQ